MGAIIFTGGIGENSPLIRKLSCQNMEDIGIHLDEKKIISNNRDTIIEIQNASSTVKILVIATNEEFEIAQQTIKQIKKGK